MSAHESFSCFLIGGDSLLVECGDLLLERGHDILGVITSNPRLGEWARGKQLRVLDAAAELQPILLERPFDYLFSITHLAVIPADILAMPRRWAINFHDGPLPEYAGLNTPAWGLINREPTWGITWHVMTAELDRGDILKQRRFDVAAGETSLTLNTRCFETAIETFGELVDELATGRCTARSQGGVQHRYFSKHQRPPAACVLDWRRPADELEARVRALDFGRYASPIGSPKIVFEKEVFLVASAFAEVSGGEGAAGLPGCILGTDADGMRVATGDGTLVIKSVTCPLGRAVSLEALAARVKHAGWDRFDELTEPLGNRLTKLNSSLARSASFWVGRLRKLEPVEAPHAGGAAAGSGAAQYRSRSLSIPRVFAERFAGPRLADNLIAGLAAYLARVSDKSVFDIAYRDPALAVMTAGIEHLVSDRVPLRVRPGADDGFDAVLQRTADELKAIRKHHTWLHDEIARDPELRGDPGGRIAGFRAVAIELSDEPSSFVPASGNVLSLVVATDGSTCLCVGDSARVPSAGIEAILREATVFLEGLGADPGRPIAKQDILSATERRRVIEELNSTGADYRRDACIHELFEEQAARNPDARAAAYDGNEINYRELNDRAERLATRLRQLGIGPDKVVGVCVERSLDLIVAVLGALKAGGAYLPLDPSYPRERLAFMIEDTNVPVIITQGHLEAGLPNHTAFVLKVDGPLDAPQPARGVPPPAPRPEPHNLAYVIYTSGSTGKPKGVMIEHRNVVNFFTGMDERIPRDGSAAQEVWLAVTSLSFDISVLELLWTLARGFKVVIHSDRAHRAIEQVSGAPMRRVEFSLYYFASGEGGGQTLDKYRLLLEGAKFADQHGFAAVWTPERHFHAFGGLYPNPSVASAALASITSRVKIRAGSVVLPLHHPVRIAEEWALVDNLSNGRVGISFASGWQPVDFVLRPENYAKRNELMYQGIETVRRLWRGEAVAFPDVSGQTTPVRTLPRPLQPELPIWVTTAGNVETWRSAGRIGANVLTHLLGQSVDEIAEKVRAYREARREAGHDPDAGCVTMMLHTFVGDDRDEVREIVRKPMTEYLASSLSLVKNVASSWAALKKRADGTVAATDLDLKHLSQEEMSDLLAFSFERYFETSGLFGTPEQCMDMVESLAAVGVDEIACLIDFGVDADTTLAHLGRLNEVREMASRRAAPASGAPTSNDDGSIGGLIRRHGVTHMQCTPSMAGMILMNDEDRAALGSLRALMIGGEAFPAVLAEELFKATGATIVNMYGPTETTVWSSTQVVKQGDGITIGRPIANTQLYILDRHMRPVPIGVVGELYIGGDGVVRGYFNRPELTAERFVADPFHAEPGRRLYRTGDLARYLPDGRVDFLGRADHQVKIRGYRIELGEIETAISRHPGVREAVVIAREDSPGDKRLVAYLTTHPGSPAPGADLRAALRESLPEFMVPSHFVILKAMPLTPNSKIDRKALPAPETIQAPAPQVQALPATQIEQTIAQIWQEVLGIRSAGVNDNFFDLGGHSLLAVKAHRKLKEAFQRNLAITDLFRFPTVRALARFLGDSADGEGGALQASEDRGAARREMMAQRLQRTQRKR